MSAISRRNFFTAAAGLGLLIRRLPAGATTVVPITLDALTQRSELVLLGTVRGAVSQWSGRFIVTDCEVEAEVVLKGELAVHARVPVRVAGGEVDGIGQMIPDAPMPERGQTYVFFLQGREEGRRLLAHMTAAVLPITLDPGGEMLIGSAPGLVTARSGTRGLAPMPSMGAGEFARVVRAAGAP